MELHYLVNFPYLFFKFSDAYHPWVSGKSILKDYEIGKLVYKK
jgi:hypothetical protein